MKKNNSIQEWLPIEQFFCNGIIKVKNNTFFIIIKVNPINYNLKTEFEKQAILNSYKIFLKNCSRETQIIIQSNKEDLNKIVKNANSQKEKEMSLNNLNIVNLIDNYINFINQKNIEKKSTLKKFYLLIKSEIEDEKKINEIREDLNEKFLKIKDSLSRCGNSIIKIEKIDEIKKIYNSFINRKIF